MTSSSKSPLGIGIEALNLYCGLACISVRALFEGRGLDLNRIDNLMMEKRSVGLPFEDPVTNAVNAAKPILDRMDPQEKERIEIVVASSESGLDYSKSITSYVHEYLELSRYCRVVEVKQACYAATGAVQLAVGYVASGISPGSKVLVVATDVPLVDARAEYAEPAMGTGGAAILIGDQPRIMEVDLGAFGTYSYETMDSARPSPRFDIADVDRSLFAYLDCLSNSFENYRSRVEEVDFVSTFDYLALHTPFSGLVRAGHRKMMREFVGTSSDQIDEDFRRRVLPSLAYPSLVGNLCSGSLYLALSSVIDSGLNGNGLNDAGDRFRVGLFSYGSGCSSEFFSGLVDNDSVAAMREMGIRRHLDCRAEVSFKEYCGLLEQNQSCLVPEANKSLDIDRNLPFLDRVKDRGEILALSGVDNYYRRYQWL